jgi:hypothetical protein
VLTARQSQFGFGTANLLANGDELNAAKVEGFDGQAFFFAEQAKQKVFSSDVLVAELVGLVGGVGQNTFAFVAKGKID